MMVLSSKYSQPQPTVLPGWCGRLYRYYSIAASGEVHVSLRSFLPLGCISRRPSTPNCKSVRTTSTNEVSKRIQRQMRSFDRNELPENAVVCLRMRLAIRSAFAVLMQAKD